MKKISRAPVLALTLFPIFGSVVRAQDEGATAPVEMTEPALTLKGFSDLNFGLMRNRESTFTLGGIDLFMTSALSEKFSVLSEIVFEFDNETNQVVLDVERIQIQYRHSDNLAVTAGRVHTSLGLWNQSFHHGTWFQTTADRPLMYRFEDDDGVLPVHAVGLEISGTPRAGDTEFEYRLLVANGRGDIPDSILNVRDLNKGKATGFLLGVKPSGSGLRAGISGYFDTLPMAEPTEEKIYGAFLEFEHRGFELLAEVSKVNHETQGRSASLLGGYVQASARLRASRPYYRFDVLDFDRVSPFFGPRTDVKAHTLGVRWDVMDFAALKVEYRSAKPAGQSAEHSGRVQLAFAF